MSKLETISEEKYEPKPIEPEEDEPFDIDKALTELKGIVDDADQDLIKDEYTALLNQKKITGDCFLVSLIESVLAGLACETNQDLIDDRVLSLRTLMQMIQLGHIK